MKSNLKKKSCLDTVKTFVIKVNICLFRLGDILEMGVEKTKKHNVPKRNILSNVHATVT